MKMNLKASLAAISAMAAAGAANAAVAAPDVSVVVTYIESLAAPVGLIGAAYIVITYAIKGWRLMRSV